MWIALGVARASDLLQRMGRRDDSGVDVQFMPVIFSKPRQERIIFFENMWYITVYMYITYIILYIYIYIHMQLFPDFSNGLANVPFFQTHVLSEFLCKRVSSA